MTKGIYPGWEADMAKTMEKRKVMPEGPLKPRSILKKDGTFVKSRKTKAAAQLGKHFISSFWDSLDDVDLYSSVSCYSQFLCVLCVCVFCVWCTH